MKKNYVVILSSIIEYVAIGLIFLVGASAYHEFLHLKTTVLLGGDGYIRSISIGSETVITVQPSNITLVMLAGGIAVSLIYSVLAFFAWRKKYVELYTALIPTIVFQGIYGIYETLFWQLPEPQYTTIGLPLTVVSAIIGFAFSIYIFYQYLKEKLKDIT